MADFHLSKRFARFKTVPLIKKWAHRPDAQERIRSRGTRGVVPEAAALTKQRSTKKTL